MRLRPHRGAASLLASLLIRCLGMTWRIEWRGVEHLEAARSAGGRIVYAFWHGRLLVLSWSHRGRAIQVLASDHYDGDLMGRTIERLGFGHLKGSTTRGGARALRTLLGAIGRGSDVGLTVDGPRGPRGRVAQGAIELARIGGAVVVPITDAARRRALVCSWDRLQIPAPFTRVVIAYGEPLSVPRGASADEREALRAELERRLHRLTADLDLELGHAGEDVWPHEDR
ncbi:MAG: lysophospholipid acyltransferase family protein [Candidatus Krumholzibacteria bacterium]|nr:lysophospholipid acyltransferase family protein [Candidatus Krumholzibacteria bacterium]